MKLKICVLYHVSVEVKSDQEIVFVTLGGKKYNRFNIVQSTDKYTKLFSFVWSTHGITTTNRKHRSVLPCVVKLKPYKELKFDLLVKFYDDVTCVNHFTGIPLSLISLECEVAKGKEKNTILNNKFFKPLWQGD